MVIVMSILVAGFIFSTIAYGEQESRGNKNPEHAAIAIMVLASLIACVVVLDYAV